MSASPQRPAQSLIDLLTGVCREQGLFDLLRDGVWQNRASLIAELRANAGPFSVALDAMAVAGMLVQADDRYRITDTEAPLLEDDIAPVLSSEQLRELLFGDYAAALEKIRGSRRRAGNDVDNALREQFLALLARAGKPCTIVDVASGDGAALAELLPPLGDAPLHVVVADADGRNLGAAAALLTERLRSSDGAVQTLLCGVEEPETLFAALELLGVALEKELVLLRRLTDAALPIDARQPVHSALSVLDAELPAHFVDRNGQCADGLAVLSARFEQLRRLAWSAGRARLIVAERHQGHWADRLLQQSDLSAEAFVLLAARAGLFGCEPVRRFPQSGTHCRASVHVLQAREYIVRHATEADLDRLEELEVLCWQHTRTSREQIAARLQRYPQGQFVLEKDGRVLGAIYSQRIVDVEALFSHTASDVHELHDPTGTIIQLLAVNIDPGAQNANYGDQLLELMLQRCSVMTGIDRVVGVTLCKSFDASNGQFFEAYLRREGSSQDPVLAFHHAHGAEILRAIPRYRPEDHANEQHGVLVSYDIHHRPDRRRAVGGSRSAFDREEIETFVRAEAARLLVLDQDEIDVDRPVMEMGLDSADLLKLQRLCEERFGLALSAGFFFENGSIRKVVDALGAIAGGQGSAQEKKTASVGRDSGERHAETDIAIVGMACRLPGGIDTPAALWRVLSTGECVIAPYPAARGRWPGATEYPGIQEGGFVQDAEAFDAAFFRISPAEAEVTDPQQRMLLELAWTCLEDAGLLPSRLRGSQTGVFVGASNCDYSRLVQEAGREIEAHHGVGSSLAILANRISYFFDLNGPSLVIDTACSSSLVALHSAVQSLRSGECTVAFAGGVNLICHPDLSVAYHKAGMLAPDARCKVFDADANGYVRSEGAVVLLLKPLRAALADGDRVHAILRGTAINHGGLASGLTVPNPQKQKELLLAAWKDARISARDLTCIEAHGTGTALGDPIEMQGIQAAMAVHGITGATPSCAVGSIKSNLGHLESAAGITGLLKVVLALRHRQIPPSIHFRQLNPKIRMEGSALVVQERLGEWKSSGPRVAAVSSFGSGGANAHVVVQEYETVRARPSDEEGDFLFVLSAATEERLQAYAARVLQWIGEEGAEVNFADAIFTWQTGRTAMKHRLAMRVKNRDQLAMKLQQWLAGDAAIGDSSTPQCMEQALAAREHRVVGVPTYPFARERHWIDSAPAPILHPLLHAASSERGRSVFTTTWSGEEFFLADHQVRLDGRAAQRVLPGVAYLEMARAAMAHALPERAAGGVLELRDIVWLQPISIDGEKEVHLALHGSGEELQYEISSETGGERIVHCQGAAVLGATAVSPLDLQQLEGQMGSPIDPPRLYESFVRMGLIYGPAFRVLTSLREGLDQLVARLRLPQTVVATNSSYALHPSVMDGAMQAAVWLVDGGSGESRPRLPFALQTVRVLASCTTEMAAWVRPAGDSGADAAAIDIDLCDVDGNVCVQLHGLSLRAPASRSSETLLLKPVWQNASVAAVTAEYGRHHVLLCERPMSDAVQIAALLPRTQCLPLQAEAEETIAQRCSRYAVACLTRVRDLMGAATQRPVLVQLVVPEDGERALLAGLSGLLQAAAQENPRLTGQLLFVPPAMTPEQLARVVREEKSLADPVVRYAGGVREALRWEEVSGAFEAPSAFHDDRLYLITGGLGALGRIFTREILARTSTARVVLTGRGALDSGRQSILDSFASDRVFYRRLDLTDRDEVRRFVESAIDQFGRLDGVVHAAGMIADNFLLKKGAAEVTSVLAPKVTGTVHLDEATRHVDLDFFVLFSSFAGALGNVGQADYAAANAFLDQFAAYRNRLVAAGQRRGRTRSIGWPLWSDGGMTMDAAAQERLAREAGMQAMSTAAGLRAFHRALALPHDHLLVLEGDAPRIRRALAAATRAFDAPSETLVEAPAFATDIEAATLAQRCEEYLRRQLAQVLKTPVSTLDVQAPLEEYGVDSMLAMKMIGQLEETFGRLPKTLFFEYRTIRSLAGYFLEEHASRLNALFSSSPTTTPATEKRHQQPSAQVPQEPLPRRVRRSVAAEPIAIVGLSGRYPGALDIDAYWRNLREGKDSVVEVPRERWDWRDFYSEDRNRGGRHFSKWGGFIEGVDEFDPQFFNIAPREAKYLDPQERLFLQHAWMAIEDAGYTRAALQVPEGSDLPGQVGVYAGVMWSEYQLYAKDADAEEVRMGFAGNLASIANRVSYVLNLHGPSMTIDTMCSSSLTAIHAACQDLRLGRTTMALAGGVNVSVHPHKYLMLSTGQFISSDGHCQSFGEGGDGYIPGEGVGVVVLKRLSDAERDGDHIYGLIRGSALTHGGKVNGYTVPNPQAQASAISRALAEAQVDARHISYVEAHGTGTKLGDPIEIAALSKAFEPYAKHETGYCLIGSTKSNVGHCEAAAGIAGLTKVLLQMQHGEIVPSLHSERLNPHIDFERTPFVVNQTLRPWEPVVDGRKLPRIAGLSSFGAGGSNAHMIVEEYVADRLPVTDAEVVIPLSARTPEQLQQKGRDLLAWLRARSGVVDLPSLAYTLQTGREPMEERLALVVRSAGELMTQLESFVAGAESIDDAFRGQVRPNREALSIFHSDPDLQQTLTRWLENRKLGKLAELWSRGLDLDWQKLYGGARPQRISLPVYPFAREHYWIDAPSAASPASAAAMLHPLLHTNVSDLREQRYHSTFGGTEAFLLDGLMPEAAQLEMLRAAVEQAMPSGEEEAQFELCDVVWGEPLVVLGETEVTVALWPAEGEGIELEIRSGTLVHCQGRARVASDEVPRVIARPVISEPVISETKIEAPVLARREIELVIAPSASSPSTPSKRPAIALSAPAAVAWPGRETAAARPKITLHAAASSTASAPSSAVRLFDRGDGIFSIEIAASRSDAIAQVLLALDRVRRQSTLRVLMLAGIEHCFLRAGRQEWNEAVQRGLFLALADFPYPVLAVQPGDVVGPGFLAAALCDVLVLDEDAMYGFTDTQRQFHPTAIEAALFAARFGVAGAQEVVFGTQPVSGHRLRSRGWTAPIVPWSVVESRAEALAVDLAMKSQDALRLLKQHLSRDLAPLVAALTPVAADERVGEAADVRVVSFGSDVVERVRELAGDETCAAIVLTIDSHAPILGAEDVLALSDVLSGAAVPVVAALQGDVGGRTALIAQFCDAAVYDRRGIYATADVAHDPQLASTAVAFFTHRLGEAAKELLLTGTGWSGAELQQRASFLDIADGEDVLSAAMQIAADCAKTPRDTWTAWKSRNAAMLRERADRASAVAPRVEEEEEASMASAIELRSSVVTASLDADGVVVVRMEDRQARNMFSPELLEGLREAFARIAATASCKVVVLTGFGPYFSSGGTKESLLAIQEGRARFTDFDVYRLPLDCELPVLAAMQGHGIGAGWSMGMFADVPLLSDESRYVSPYMSYGFTPGAGATYSLTAKLSRDLARESLLTAGTYDGRDLKARGAALHVLPRAEVLDAALAMARQMARFPRRRLVALKARLNAQVHEPLAEDLRRELAMHDQTFVGRADTLARIEEKFRQEGESAHPRPVVVVPPIETTIASGGDALRDVIATLRTMLANELQLAPNDLDEQAQFVDLGLDSISGVTWIRKINQRYGLAIEATRVYAHPTLMQLGRHVKEEAEASGTLPAAAPVLAPVKAAEVFEPRRAALTPRRQVSERFLGGGRAARKPEPVAVIGMAGQFPQARNLEEFWQNIAAGRDCIAAVPPERWNADALYQPGQPAPGKVSSRWAGMIDGYAEFDPLFFNISPTEAEHMDPQQRVFLQACWQAVESAGYAARSLSGTRCGVFAGCGAGDYQQLSRPHQLSAQGFTGNAASILAARISYFLNLQGPCVSIDTACSSSLVAVASACDSLTSGSSDLALAGGVYIMSGPEMHIRTSQAGMLSADGRCFTFDTRANGFVPGEGAGVLLLKRLSDAIRDEDAIHAVIHGWGVNQDGKTNGITAPNPQSQTRLEQEVYDRFGIDPAAIDLVEAHGTGTKLGDPIEVEGLKNAFRKYTQNAGYCALGSVKSNIGHCLNAAGVAGLLKLVLALKHRQLPPSIHFQQLNEHIELQGSPFYVNDRLRDWSATAERARLAATSSFGFSGTNAHVVVGEYVPGEKTPRRTVATIGDGRTIVPLSAKTPEQLEQKGRDLLALLRANAAIDLFELSYTLQIGRDAMEERVSFVAGSIGELVASLQSWLSGTSGVDGVHRGRITRTTESTSLLNQDEDVREAIVQKWIAEQKLGKLAELWAHGLDVSWDRLYGQHRPRRMALPLYPFARERYWIEAEADAHSRAHPVTVPAALPLHPLLHSNTSDFSSQRYRSTFAGDEFFLRDHRVRAADGQIRKLLPGVAYLEMARAAIAQAAPSSAESGVLELRDTTWLEPVVATDATEVSIALVSGEDGSVEYEIYGWNGEREITHCRGAATFSAPAGPARVDLASVRRRTQQRTLPASEVYAICEAMGLHYGPAHQAIGALHIGEEELIADLRLPAVVDSGSDQFVLHPSLLDSALQASIGLIVDPGRLPAAPYVPFAVEAVRVFGACTREMTAWVRHASARRMDEKTAKVDIDLCDPAGHVRVEIRGFALRALEAAREMVPPAAAVRLPIKAGGNGRHDGFDETFYEKLIHDIENHKLTIDEATAMS